MKKYFILIALMLALPTPAMAHTSLTGDVNRDGKVNITDLNAVIDIILDGKDTTLAGDVNLDGTVNINDVNAIINIILGGPSHPIDIDEHDWVDLGLPSGTLWATRNVGASSPEDYGGFFAWGETEPKVYFDVSNYKWYGNSDLLKYNNNDHKWELDPSDDAAYVHYGGHMPSYGQIYELGNSCTWQWTQRNGVNGALVTGPNGNTMFLPAAGACSLDYFGVGAGESGSYWSRERSSYGGLNAFSFYFNTRGWDWHWNEWCRFHGLTVRAVREL